MNKRSWENSLSESKLPVKPHLNSASSKKKQISNKIRKRNQKGFSVCFWAIISSESISNPQQRHLLVHIQLSLGTKGSIHSLHDSPFRTLCPTEKSFYLTENTDPALFNWGHWSCTFSCDCLIRISCQMRNVEIFHCSSQFEWNKTSDTRASSQVFNQKTFRCVPEPKYFFPSQKIYFLLFDLCGIPWFVNTSHLKSQNHFGQFSLSFICLIQLCFSLCSRKKKGKLFNEYSFLLYVKF